jgi:transcriptional regulator with XRE-family HTH domain
MRIPSIRALGLSLRLFEARLSGLCTPCLSCRSSPTFRVASPARTAQSGGPFCSLALSAKKPRSGAYPVSFNTLGDYLRKWRLDLKLLPKDVVGILGVDTNTITNWGKNRCQPRLYLIPRMAQFLGYDPFTSAEAATIGERIKAFRRLHGLSQKILARQLGIDPSTLARWEKDKGRPLVGLRTRLEMFLTCHGTSCP